MLDAGPVDVGQRGSANCPHCGAFGRYVHTFIVADGRRLAAMSGCVQLFPVAPVAREEQRLRAKLEEYAKKGWTLNRGDQGALDAIEAFHAGTMTEQTALSICRSAKAANVMRAQTRGRR